MWIQARSQTFLWGGCGWGKGGQSGQILGHFMITRGLSCDRVGLGHFFLTPPPPPPRGGLGFRNKTPILPTVKMLGLGGERLTPKVLDHYLQHNLVMPLLFFFTFIHLRNLDHHHNLISSSWYYTQDPSVQFHPNPFLRFWVMLSTNRQMNQRYQN